jgi:hypothetical protein
LTCDAGTQSSIERITYSMAIERPRVFTQPGPTPEVG